MPTPRKYADPAERQAAYRRRRSERDRAEKEVKGLPPLPAIATLPGDRRWQAMIRQAIWLLETTHSEMEAYYDERSETWQESEKGEDFMERMAGVENAQIAVEELNG